MTPKFLLVTFDYPPRTGGVARYYAELSRALGGEVAVMTDVPGPSLAAEPFTYRIRFAWRWWPHWLPLLWLIPRYLKKTAAHTVWVGDLVPVGWAALILNLWRRVPYFISVHGLDIQFQTTRSRLKRWLVYCVLRRAQFVTANSNFTAGLVTAWGIVPKRVLILYPAPSQLPETTPKLLQALKATYKLQGKLVLLTVARLVPRKGIDRMLAALSELHKQFPNLVYVVVGDGPDRKRLESMAQELGVYVVFTGEVEDTELAAWYALCDVFVLVPTPTAHDVEGFGMVLVEAQAAGKPVIGSQSGGVPEAVGEAGYLIQTQDELRAALGTLLKDPAERKRLGQAGQKHAQAFTWAAQAGKLKARLYGAS